MIRFLLVLFIGLSGLLPSFGQSYGNEWIDFSKTYYKFPVRENRFYRIPYSTLTAYGLNGIPAEQFQLWRDGKEVPVYTSVPAGILPSTGYIEFYGTINNGFDESGLYNNPAWQTLPEKSFFLDTAWYFLTVNPTGINKRFTETPNTVNTTTLPADSFYMETVKPLLASTTLNAGLPRIIGSDAILSSVWDKGEAFCSGRFDYFRTVEYKFTALNAFLNGPSARFQYQVAGVGNKTRRAIIQLNNKPFDSISVVNYDMAGKTITGIPLSNLSGDTVSFKFNSQYDTVYDNLVVTQFYFSYPRRFFYNGQPPLQFTMPATNKGNHIRLKGLPNSNFLPVLYDFNNLKRYVGVIKSDSSLFAIGPSTTDRDLVIGTQNPSHIRSVTTMKVVNFLDFSQVQNQGDYLMITNSLLRQEGDPVEAYRAYRNSSVGGGYNARIYDIDELAEQFSYGVRKNPLAIRRFILYAIDHFTVRPKMVFLIGRGNAYNTYYRASVTIKEYMNLVPTWGSPASDNLLAARSNLNPYPEIPIGRLSAVSPDEVRVYLDKIIAFEHLQRKKPALPSDNEWRKRILHLVGGDDVFVADSILWRYMTNFGEIIKIPPPGGIVNQFKRADNPDFAQQIKFVEDRISAGAGLITYFGHSSSSSIDFNMGSPDMYDNKDGKFPVIVANGCRAGNIFDYSPQRLSARETFISDNFIFAPNKGAIAFISNSDLGSINFQNLLTREWYTSFSSKKFGKTIGEIQQDALKTAWSKTANSNAGNQFVNRCNIEQNILHADPAIVPFIDLLPDFAVEAAFMETHPGKVLTELDSASIKVHYFNLGTAVRDSVRLTLEREMPDGTSELLYNARLANVFNRDSLSITIGLKGLFEEGPGFIVARIDPANDWQEGDKDNNVAVIPFNLVRANILPVYPANFAIQNTPDLVLKASTTNPLDGPAIYHFQMDTTTRFDSPMNLTLDTFAKAGLVEWKPVQTLVSGRVYYWRVSLAGTPITPETPVFSFVYLPGQTPGFNQSHYFQHKQSTFKQLELPAHENWTYGRKQNNIYVSHGVYATSGTEETHFSITTNGEMKMRSACIGRSIIFNLFDSLTFEPIKNTPIKAFGSADSCAPYREYNFEFNYYDHTKRKIIMDFLDSIPRGTFVAARLVADRPYDSLLVKYWKNDTAIYGSGRSLYHSLLNLGFYDIDSLTRPRTFFFMFQKGDSSIFKPYSKFSEGVNDRLFTSIYVTTIQKEGSVSSPWVGPAKQWASANWVVNPSPGPAANQLYHLQLWGKTIDNQILMLNEWDTYSDTIDISGIDPAEYPYLQFRMETAGNYGDLPAQLVQWRLHYTPLPDGAFSPEDWFTLNKDTLNPAGDTLKLELAFKNITETLLDSTRVRISLMDAQGNETLQNLQKFKILAAGDTAILHFEKAYTLPAGDYVLRIEANGEGMPAELNYFNNRAMLPFKVSGGTLPIWLVNFDAIRDGKMVRLQWKALPNEALRAFHVEHSTTGGPFKQIAAHVKPSGIAGGMQLYQVVHDNPERGLNYYRLKMEMNNGGVKYSETRKIAFDSPGKVMAAPNPFTAYFYIYPINRDENWQLTIFDALGRPVKTAKGNGTQRIDLSGSPQGVYWLKWSSGNESEIIKMLKH